MEKILQNRPDYQEKNEENISYDTTEREKIHDEMGKKFKEKQTTSEEKIRIIENAVVEELNKKHAVVHTDQFHILTEKRHRLFEGIDFTLESKQSFLNTYENQIPAGHTKSKARIWLSHSNRRQYGGIIFDPTDVGHKKGLYNIWRGFAVEPRKGTCELFKIHIEEVICAGNKTYFEYLWKWLAYLVQKPNEISTGIVLMGSQGTGKGKFAKSLGKLFGQHFIHLDDLNLLLGRFNFHMKDGVLIFADEAVWGGSKRDIGKLKAMVTEECLMIEGKGKDVIPVRNFRHLILSSNEELPVHLDPDDRRFLILKVSEKHKEDYSYFKAIDAELANGGFEALFYELLHENISDFNPRELPPNLEAFDLKMESATSSEQYLYHALREGCFDIGNETPALGWREEILVSSVFADYLAWCVKQRDLSIKQTSNTAFGKILFKHIPSIRKIRPASKPPEKKRPEHYILPELDKAREEFQKSFKVNSKIWT